ncbi:MAG: hypothetical protein ACREDN_03690 [Aestuariivirga sp.]
MHEIIKINEHLHARMIEEVEVMLAERTMLRDVAIARGRALQAKFDEELRRIALWSQSQREAVKEVFSAMLAENDFDVEKHDDAIHRLYGDNAPAAKPPAAKPKLEQIHSSAAE